MVSCLLFFSIFWHSFLFFGWFLELGSDYMFYMLQSIIATYAPKHNYYIFRFMYFIWEFYHLFYSREQSDSASVKIPEIDLELASGTLGGMVTTIEGLVTKICESKYSSITTWCF